ncbi:ABC transporter ATP-binding protein [Raineyella fluvialis]|uniref:ATP-binding cassette domain-containing protein n=1 Tax=Raineyella fluvialis TaxID=2662261 RepID=A0A5Q2F8B9_9ACTN|nr:ABC transporter ATP-binding protein [Raineyella fluvialis]QGF23069.1 ATP-binding cassette domain-containing protein [Raineyella fluvialis]
MTPTLPGTSLPRTDLPPTTVSLRSVSRRYGKSTVLDGLDLDIGAGDFVALLGRSGSGKSTLLRALAGLDAEATGTVEVTGATSVAFQQPRLLPWRRVWQNVVLGLPRTAATRERAAAALAEVDLAGYGERWPATLSGGQAQRVSLARALVREPALLLLDEPFGALDALTRLAMHDVLEELWRRHRFAVLLVTHDVDEAVRLADRLLVLRDGRIQADHRNPTDRPRTRAATADLRQQVLTDLGVTHHD